MLSERRRPRGLLVLVAWLSIACASLSAVAGDRLPLDGQAAANGRAMAATSLRRLPTLSLLKPSGSFGAAIAYQSPAWIFNPFLSAPSACSAKFHQASASRT